MCFSLKKNQQLLKMKQMKCKTALISLLLFAFISVESQDDNGWKELFNGKNLKGW